jgi:hypothetical protein
MCGRVHAPHSPAEQSRLDHQVRVRHICCGGVADLRSNPDVGPVDLVAEEDYFPFEVVTLRRVCDVDGEPTALVDIEGLRDGGMRSRRVRYGDLLDHADVHLEFAHHKIERDPVGAREFAHTVMRAAVACLMD